MLFAAKKARHCSGVCRAEGSTGQLARGSPYRYGILR